MKKSDNQFVQQLFDAAVKAMANSYSPYSKYKVGAAVAGEDGSIYSGTNIENASYGLTICAERSAIFNAVGSGQKQIKAIALVTSQKDLKQVGSPCGACRQVIAEFALPDTPLYIANYVNGKAVKTVRKKLKDFFPMPFSPASLDDKKTKK